MILETERLTLTPVQEGDEVPIFPVIADAEVMAHLDRAGIDDPDEVADLVRQQIREMAEERAFYWTVRRNADGACLGVCELTDVDWRHHRAEIGLMLARQAWGQGFGREAMLAVLGHAAGLGFRRLWARTHVGHLASEALLTRLGFEQEGYLRGHVDRDGERGDCRLWGLLL